MGGDMAELAALGQAVSIVFACLTFIFGVNAWRREFIGKKKIELAEQILSKFFEVKDAISAIRNPFSNTGEGKTRKRNEYELESDSKILDQAYVVNERMQKYDKLFAEFFSLKYRAMATYGKQIEGAYTGVGLILRSILVSAMALGEHYWQRQGRVKMSEAEFKKHLEEMHRHEGIFWARGGSDDEICLKLDDIQRDLEQILGPCFEEPMTLVKLLTAPLTKRKD